MKRKMNGYSISRIDSTKLNLSAKCFPGDNASWPKIRRFNDFNLILEVQHNHAIFLMFYFLSAAKLMYIFVRSRLLQL
jgi:hypothetical protein